MTAVFVHGNPETADVWGPLLAELRKLGYDDLVCLSPPGFGAPRPAGFGATVSEYRDWLIAELERFDGPVDLVGHDWGGGHVVLVAMTRPDLLRSWVSDVVGLFEPDYVWHDLAQIWQTPGDGEAHVAELFGGRAEDRAETMVGFGMPREVASAIAPAQDAEMGRAVLDLYRSAAQPAMAELGRDLPAAAARPGLHVVATGDPFAGDEDLRRRGSERAGATTTALDGVGHWWLAEDPAGGARALAEFWAAPM
jgi:pimeloyl-ACP methyl ester carboxylesterase